MMPMPKAAARKYATYSRPSLSHAFSIELLRFAPSSLAAAGTNRLLDLQIHFDV